MRRVQKAGHPPTSAMGWSRDREGVEATIAQLSAEMITAIAVPELTKAEQVNIASKVYFETLLNKVAARTNLHLEQGELCAFCEGRVSNQQPVPGRPKPSGMRIAHWIPRSEKPELTLTWSNLDGSCHTMGEKREEHHCDVFQRDESPPGSAPTPAQIAYADWLLLSSDGALRPTPDAPTYVQQVIDLLNLNASKLKSARSSTLEGFRQRFESSRGDRPYRREHLAQELASLDRARSGTVTYPTARRLWLVQRIAREP